MQFRDLSSDLDVFDLFCLTRPSYELWKNYVPLYLRPKTVLLILLTKISIWIWKHFSKSYFPFFLSSILETIESILLTIEIIFDDFSSRNDDL